MLNANDDEFGMKGNPIWCREFGPVRLALCILALICVLPVGRDAAQARVQNGYGPEVKSFLDLMRHEEDELEFQIKHNEITRKEYVRSKNRIAIHRKRVLSLVEETSQDHLPELHVVAAAELEQLIEDGTAALRGIKRGDVIKQKWRYLGSENRGEVFYIFERVPRE